VFQTTMSIELVNEGPVTILLDSDKTFFSPVIRLEFLHRTSFDRRSP